MVRVLSVHHFGQQHVSRCPPAICSVAAGDSCVVTAHRHLVLRVNKANNGVEKEGRGGHYDINSLDVVRQIVYCPMGRYLLTLEGEPGSVGSGVRVYANWADPKSADAPVRPRLLGCSGAAASAGEDDEPTLDVIEFPQQEPPLCVAACSSSGNVCVAAADSVAVYRQISPGTARNPMDFQELLSVAHTFVPSQVALCEDVLALICPRELRVFKIRVGSAAADGGREWQPRASFSTDDDSDRPFERCLPSMSMYSFSSTSEDAEQEASGAPGPKSALVTSANGDKTQEPVSNVTKRRQQDSECSDSDGGQRLEG